jgi:MFS superfamily sulfate permease-like transporter
VTGIVGGLVVGTLAGAPLQVSGPAAGLTVIMLELYRGQAEALGAEAGFAVVSCAVAMAGLMQVAAGALGLGQWFRAVSPAVIHGMLTGIGVIILVGQFHKLFDLKAEGTGLKQMLAVGGTLSTAFGPDGAKHLKAAALGIPAVALIFLWKPLVPGRLKMLPASLVAVVGGAVALAAAQALADMPVATVVVEGNILSFIKPPTADALPHLPEGRTLLAAATIAFIASAETLLCATAVDALHTGPRTRYDKELAAQGIGNTLCGLAGALPMTGVIVRSAANVEAGARTRLSAVLHGLWLLVLAGALPWLLAYIPISVLAAVLVVTGWRLIDARTPITLWKENRRGEAVIYLVVVAVIVAEDLLTGVVVGVGLSLLKLAYTMSHLDATLTPDPAADGPAGQAPRMRLSLKGAATFLALPRLAAVLERVPPGTELHADLDSLSYIDHACLELLHSWEKQHAASGGKLVIDWHSVHGLSHAPRR